MNITEAVERACEEPTLIDALSFICVWDSERAIKQALRNNGKSWETCFKICIKAVIEKYQEKLMSEKNTFDGEISQIMIDDFNVSSEDYSVVTLMNLLPLSYKSAINLLNKGKIIRKITEDLTAMTLEKD